MPLFLDHHFSADLSLKFAVCASLGTPIRPWELGATMMFSKSARVGAKIAHRPNLRRPPQAVYARFRVLSAHSALNSSKSTHIRNPLDDMVFHTARSSPLSISRNSDAANASIASSLSHGHALSAR